MLPKLKEKWIDTGKAKLVLRDYPLDEPALRAAMVARCAPAERFYPLIDTFFAQQEQWVTLARLPRRAGEAGVKLGGISKKEFDACIGDKTLEDQVAQSRLDRRAAARRRLDADLLHQRQEIRRRADRRGFRSSTVRRGPQNHDQSRADAA